MLNRYLNGNCSLSGFSAHILPTAQKSPSTNIRTMVTKRTAYATVKNNTNQPLIAVSLLHKYSDDYSNSQTYDIIKSGATGEPKLEVQYHTGFLTTGRDWWVVMWYSPDVKTVFYSDPANFRGFIDGMESLAPDVISGVAGTVAGLLTANAAPSEAVKAGAAASALAKATSEALFNTESTEGFKQHILREEDEHGTVEIAINEGGEVVISSKSGVSKTKYSSRAV